MSNTNLSTPAYRFRNALNFTNEVKTNPYYLFVGDHIPHANSDLQDLSSDQFDTAIFPYRNMIFGKRIANTDISFVIRKIQWDSDTVYSMYDDQDENLQDSDFYVEVNEGSFYHLWKCLDNNNGANSTIEPSFAAGSNTELYQTSDGYRWKYITSTDSAIYDKFVSAEYVPIISNTSVSNSAIAGAIDIIKVNNQGARYNNYLDGSFHSSNLRLNGNTLLYEIANNISVSTNGYYTGCLLYLSGGTGIGQYKRVNNYISNTSGNILEIETEFDIAPLNGTTYEIRPEVIITPIGESPSVNCVARALVNADNSNSIFRIEILNRGADYNECYANIVANSIIGITNTAAVRVINGPYGGHGFWQYQELFCEDIELSVSLANTINGLVPSENFYQQIGIIRDPLFANVNFRIESPTDSFTIDEPIYQFTRIQLNTNVTCNTSNTLLKSNTANWVYQAIPDDYLILTNQDATINELVQINAVVNATAITLKEFPSFACSECIVSKANLEANAVVSSVNSANNILVTNCSGNFTISGKVIGSVSGAVGILSQIIRNDTSKTFSTFIQLDKYTSTLLSGTFSQNEVITQGNNTAYLFSMDGNANLYVTNYSGPKFHAGSLIVGNTSAAVAQITNVFSREIVYNSGEVMYIENIEPVTRSNSQTEVHQLIMSF